MYFNVLKTLPASFIIVFLERLEQKKKKVKKIGIIYNKTEHVKIYSAFMNPKFLNDFQMSWIRSSLYYAKHLSGTDTFSEVTYVSVSNTCRIPKLSGHVYDTLKKVFYILSLFFIWTLRRYFKRCSRHSRTHEKQVCID